MRSKTARICVTALTLPMVPASFVRVIVALGDPPQRLAEFVASHTAP
jgi:hypothetical protein